jgi:hypothetical protein
MKAGSHLHQSLDELDRLPAGRGGVLVVQGLYLLGDLPEPGLEVLCEGRGSSIKAWIKGSVSAPWGWLSAIVFRSMTAKRFPSLLFSPPRLPTLSTLNALS